MACKFEIARGKSKKTEEYYFVLKAENGKVIATSEMYASKANAKKGVESVVKSAASAEIVDTTEEKK
ncbi:MAG: YegP family protein [Clostridiales bacterium]|jgi:uncharacterized protein YegP (UPF0339 family)|nr:YegP family protein [Clostridiales bacterium]